MFFEVLHSSGSARHRPGHDHDGQHWLYERVVLQEAFHLSYPYGSPGRRYYMVPETLEPSHSSL